MRQLAEALATNQADALHRADLELERVTEAVEVHSNRLTKSLEKRHAPQPTSSGFPSARTATRCASDGLVAFQREMRHEVGRLGHLVVRATEFARPAETGVEDPAGAAAREASEPWRQRPPAAEGPGLG